MALMSISECSHAISTTPSLRRLWRRRIAFAEPLYQQKEGSCSLGSLPPGYVRAWCYHKIQPRCFMLSWQRPCHL